MMTTLPFRPATVADCPTLARLMQIASDGVTDYIWSSLQEDYPGLTPLEIGAQRYADPTGLFSYRNTILATTGDAIQGMMLTFPIPPHDPTADQDASSGTEAEATEPDVLAPYALEQPNSWYICALAMFPEYRGQGLGTQFLQLAAGQARSRGLQDLSLLCFEQNVGALRLYHRNGFQVIDRTPVVPHPLIHFTGDILLMSKRLS